jgi:hypothetical protein
MKEEKEDIDDENSVGMFGRLSLGVKNFFGSKSHQPLRSI